MEIIIFHRLGIIAFAYIIGSIPFGLILTRAFTSVDITKEGSGNIGAANVRRLAGSTLGMLTLAGDLLKGALPVFLALLLSNKDTAAGEIYICLAAFFSFLGHLYPLYMKLKGGGKGVATAAGCFLIISPFACMLAVFVFIIFILFCNRVSAGSLASAVVLPFSVWIVSKSAVFTVFAFIIAVLIFVRHKENIRRIISGNEPVIWEKTN